MKKILFFVATALICSCQKRDVVVTPDFNVTPEKLTYKVGETVNFNITGNPDNIVFWSGVPGKKYEFKDRTVEAGAKLFIYFNSYQQFVVHNDMTVLVSNNYNGINDVNNVNAATWVDITNRVVLSNGADQTPSGRTDLTEFTAGNKSVTLAFRYTTTQLRAQTRWVIRTFNAEKEDKDGGVTNIATLATAGWTQLSFANPAVIWTITTAQLLCGGSTTALDDDWVFTKSFNVTAATPDQGVAIKNTATSLSTYSTVYTTPGIYKLTFVATNASYVNQESQLKEMTLTVTP
jgi:hypothetical protein